ncbi:MAG: adenylosuccinate synthase [Candidatus Cloacimonetes bacterium 4572_55]|nr:MAG: adenylosuccinate synthase [Candidatus Cloacimonetes bacterium 4572_55]
MRNTAIIGAQWGDEGKAKIVDILSRDADVIVRYQGGANAGHTVVKDGVKFIFHLVPTGALYPDKTCVIGNGVVLDPEQLLEEISCLEEKGIFLKDRLKISGNAHIVFPFHKLLDSAMETDSAAQKIGTTLRGIGPAYTDKMRRIGVRIYDLYHPDVLKERLETNLKYKNAIIREIFHKKEILLEEILSYCMKIASRIESMVCDTGNFLHQRIREGDSILFEGAQGTLLDIDFGTYPYLTSSNPTIGGLFSGTGVNPGQLDEIIGIAKAYQTRVGDGPFPTELIDETGDKLRQSGNEYGATTGRPRRCGWLDLAALRYAVKINGFTRIALTKIDVLDKFDTIYICTGYQISEEEGSISRYPEDSTRLAQCQPIYKELPGWEGTVRGATDYKEFPKNARRFIEKIENFIHCQISLISTGPDRTEIVRRY